MIRDTWRFICEHDLILIMFVNACLAWGSVFLWSVAEACR